MTDQEMEESFISIFNGHDLTGWKEVGTTGAWNAENGELICSGEGRGWIRPLGIFEDFILRLKYRIAVEGNSGIFVRTSEEGRPAFQGMEIQILDDAGKPVSVKSTGAIYDSVAPTKDMSKPAGEWNDVEVVCNGRQVQVTLNGEQIIDTNLDDHGDLKDRLQQGYIGVQNHRTGVAFKNIRLKEL